MKKELRALNNLIKNDNLDIDAFHVVSIRKNFIELRGRERAKIVSSCSFIFGKSELFQLPGASFMRYEKTINGITIRVDLG